ncbi:unnamed protein product [Moneuplotes crassus]|uniref:Uncharacterized protein n=1 Tax=Euplotes crassus TaxID=5936 RepID=A0AAD2D7F2_EUPCR|nr:unnamed protein product [Moneuplotes crassus]
MFVYANACTQRSTSVNNIKIKSLDLALLIFHRCEKETSIKKHSHLEFRGYINFVDTYLDASK